MLGCYGKRRYYPASLSVCVEVFICVNANTSDGNVPKTLVYVHGGRRRCPRVGLYYRIFPVFSSPVSLVEGNGTQRVVDVGNNIFEVPVYGRVLYGNLGVGACDNESVQVNLVMTVGLMTSAYAFLLILN